uniref:Transmembrane protein 236 n=1 Tax=Nothobranchius furzeri TaxID=105023 RepID=A0A8C6NMA3_NOTFU
MGSGSVLKFALCEVLQFAGLCVPLLIVMQRFAVIVAKVKTSAQPRGDGSTAYWLIVASSIAYVTSTALFIWVPLKYLVFVKKRFIVGRKKWRPVALVYVILSTLPSFAFLIASSEQITPVTPISPVVSGPAVPGQNIPGQGVPTSLQPGATGQLNDRNQNGARPETNGTVPGMPTVPGRPFNVSGLSSQSASTAAYRISPYTYTGPLRFLCVSDARADVFVDSFMFWMDTVEMVRVAGHPLVYYSGWVFPIYIFSYVSCLRVVVMPHTPLLSSLGVALQDLPFFFVRVGLIAFFGFVTPILYLMKNLLVCLAFVYFNFMTKLRVFNTERMFF